MQDYESILSKPQCASKPFNILKLYLHNYQISCNGSGHVVSFVKEPVEPATESFKHHHLTNRKETHHDNTVEQIASHPAMQYVVIATGKATRIKALCKHISEATTSGLPYSFRDVPDVPIERRGTTLMA